MKDNKKEQENLKEACEELNEEALDEVTGGVGAEFAQKENAVSKGLKRNERPNAVLKTKSASRMDAFKDHT